MKEKSTLLEVGKDGEELILLDGRRLMVDPGDIPTACIWLPTTELEISEGDKQAIFPVIVRNIEDKEEIKAMWL